MNLSSLTWRESYLKIKDQSCNPKNSRPGEIYNRTFDTYKCFAMQHGKHMSKTAYYMAMETKCEYP